MNMDFKKGYIRSLDWFTWYSSASTMMPSAKETEKPYFLSLWCWISICPILVVKARRRPRIFLDFIIHKKAGDAVSSCQEIIAAAATTTKIEYMILPGRHEYGQAKADPSSLGLLYPGLKPMCVLHMVS